MYSAQTALFLHTVTSGALNDDSSTTRDPVAVEPSRTKSCSPQASARVCDSVVIHCKMDNLGWCISNSGLEKTLTNNLIIPLSNKEKKITGYLSNIEAGRTTIKTNHRRIQHVVFLMDIFMVKLQPHWHSQGNTDVYKHKTFSECTIHGHWMAVNLPLALKESQEMA